MHRHTPDRDEPIYVISVAARMVNLHPQTLRHYERLGLVEPARRGNQRIYSQRDIEKLTKIAQLMDDLGVNLAGVEVILNMSRQIEELQAQVAQMEVALQVEIERSKNILHDQRHRQPRLPEPSEK
jgi:MerR family transcriptional regulator/heat shock protein HspR